MSWMGISYRLAIIAMLLYSLRCPCYQMQELILKVPWKVNVNKYNDDNINDNIGMLNVSQFNHCKQLVLFKYHLIGTIIIYLKQFPGNNDECSHVSWSAYTNFSVWQPLLCYCSCYYTCYQGLANNKVTWPHGTMASVHVSMLQIALSSEKISSIYLESELICEFKIG